MTGSASVDRIRRSAAFGSALVVQSAGFVVGRLTHTSRSTGLVGRLLALWFQSDRRVLPLNRRHLAVVLDHWLCIAVASDFAPD